MYPLYTFIDIGHSKNITLSFSTTILGKHTYHFIANRSKKQGIYLLSRFIKNSITSVCYKVMLPIKIIRL